jgi:hypothetical protein
MYEHYARTDDDFNCLLVMQGKGRMTTYWLKQKHGFQPVTTATTKSSPSGKAISVKDAMSVKSVFQMSKHNVD